LTPDKWVISGCDLPQAVEMIGQPIHMIHFSWGGVGFGIGGGGPALENPADEDCKDKQQAEAGRSLWVSNVLVPSSKIGLRMSVDRFMQEIL